MSFTGALGAPLARPGLLVLGFAELPGGVWLEVTRGDTWTEAARMPTWTERTRNVTWSAPTMTALVKRAAESRLYTMDLSNLPEVVGGDTVSSVTGVTATIVSTAPAGAAALTVGATAVASGNKGATAVLSGGTDGTTYLLTFKVQTAGGYTLVGIGYLYVDDR